MTLQSNNDTLITVFGGSGFAPWVDELLAVGTAPFSWFASIPAAGGYLFQVVFCAVSLAIDEYYRAD